MKLFELIDNFYNDANKSYQFNIVTDLDFAFDEVEEYGNLKHQFDLLLCTIYSGYKSKCYLQDDIINAEVEGWFIKDNIIYVGIERR